MRLAVLFIVCFCRLAAVADAQTVNASASVQETQFDNPSSQSYSGSASGLPNLFESVSDGNRTAIAGVSVNGVYIYSDAFMSGIDRPYCYANLYGYQVTFADTPALSAAIAANNGQPLQMYADFPVAFTMLNTQNPSLNAFNQTTTGVTVSIGVTGLLSTTVSGQVSGSNGPFSVYTISTSGFAQPSMIDAGFSDVQVPFTINGSNLTSTFDIDASGYSLSLDLDTNSSVTLLTPSFSNVYLASGLPPSSLGLSFHTDLVPTRTLWASAVNGNWSNSNDWTGGVPNSDGAGAVIGASNTANLTVTVDAPQTVGTLVLSSGAPRIGYTLSGGGSNTLTFSNTSNNAPAVISINDGAHFIDVPVVLASNLLVTSTSSTPWTLTFGTASSITDNGGHFGLTLTASNGTLILSGSDDYTGCTMVTAGTLVVGSGTALPNGACLIVGALSGLAFDPTQVASSTGDPPATIAVPEPPSIALLAVGLSALVACGWRSSRRWRQRTPSKPLGLCLPGTKV